MLRYSGINVSLVRLYNFVIWLRITDIGNWNSIDCASSRFAVLMNKRIFTLKKFLIMIEKWMLIPLNRIGLILLKTLTNWFKLLWVIGETEQFWTLFKKQKRIVHFGIFFSKFSTIWVIQDDKSHIFLENYHDIPCL